MNVQRARSSSVSEERGWVTWVGQILNIQAPASATQATKVRTQGLEWANYLLGSNSGRSKKDVRESKGNKG